MVSNVSLETTTSAAVQPVQNSVTTEATKKTEQTTSTPEISPAYSVEISQEGAQLSADSSNVVQTTAIRQSNSDTKVASSNATEAKAAPPAKPPTQMAKSSDDSSSTTATSSDLSQYSEAQLEQLLSQGKISASDYNTEIAKRQQEQASTTASNTTTDLISSLTTPVNQ
ncbi:MAG: hypothetical protein E6713_07000 [Sporomusaceae bacterium]|nr:hypothetical protein [Sporomusaceae bacterium]